jgi:hypothetical protein
VTLVEEPDGLDDGASVMREKDFGIVNTAVGAPVSQNASRPPPVMTSDPLAEVSGRLEKMSERLSPCFFLFDGRYRLISLSDWLYSFGFLLSQMLASCQSLNRRSRTLMRSTSSSPTSFMPPTSVYQWSSSTGNQEEYVLLFCFASLSSDPLSPRRAVELFRVSC